MKPVELKKIADEANDLEETIKRITMLAEEAAKRGEYSLKEIVSVKIMPYLIEHFTKEGFKASTVMGFSPILQLSWG